MKLALRILVYALCLFALGGAMWRAIQGGEAPTRQAAEQATSDERYIAYVANHERGPRFRLGPASRELRVLSYLHLDSRVGPEAYSPATTYDYGLEWTVREASGERVESGVVWLQTRKSKAGFEDDTWREHSVYYPVGQGEGEPCDGRLTDLDLTPYRGAGRTVEFRPVGEDDELNLIVFERFERNEFEEQWLTRVLSQQRRAELADQARVRSWTELTTQERLAILDQGWRRRSSLSEVSTRNLYSTDFRIDADLVPPDHGTPLDVERAAALNVAGPANIRLGFAGPPDQAISIRTDILTGGEAVDDLAFSTRRFELETIPARLGAGSPQQLDAEHYAVVTVPAGATQTIHIHLEDGPRVRLHAWSDRASALLGEPEAYRVGDKWQLFTPDWKAFSQWSPVPDEPATYLLRRRGVSLGDAVRINVRAVGDAAGDARLLYQFTNGDEVIQEGALDASDEMSAFERVDAEAPEETALRVTEPQSFRFWIPEGATHLTLRHKEGVVLVGVSALVLGEDGEQARKVPPYDTSPPGMAWRYAPLEHEAWQSLWPDNQEDLERAGGLRRVRAQARLRPDWGAFDEDADVSAAVLVQRQCEESSDACAFAARFEVPEPEPEPFDAVVLEPRGVGRSRVIVERADIQPTNDEFARQLLRAWGASYKMDMPVGTSVPCRAPGDGTLGVELRATDLAILGRRLEAYWDGELIERRVLRTTGSRPFLRIPSGADAGRLEVRVDPPLDSPGGVRILADCAPSGPTTAAEVVRLRRVWRVGTTRDVSIRMYTTEEDAPSVNVVAYYPDSLEPLTMDAEVDDGSVRLARDGPVEQITAARRRLEFPPAADQVRFRRDASTRLRGPTSAAIPMGRDWSSGWHTVGVRVVAEESDYAWVRFFAKPRTAEVLRRLE